MIRTAVRTRALRRDRIPQEVRRDRTRARTAPRIRIRDWRKDGGWRNTIRMLEDCDFFCVRLNLMQILFNEH